MRLVPSSGGVFEIMVNGQLLYSKKETGTFPDVEEMIEKIKKLT
jgi:selenoprotein W-related protein